jgi:hypothetical protein
VNRPLRLFLRYYVTAFSLFVREPTFRALGLAALAVLLTGTVFYHFAEDWTWADSLYFTTVTLASVGYGDFVPTSEASRIFTVVYIILGLGIVAGFLSTLVKAPLLMEQRQVPRLPLDASKPPLPSARRRVRRQRTSRRNRRPRSAFIRTTGSVSGVPDDPTGR